MSPNYSFDASELIRDGKIQAETLNQLKDWCDSQKLPNLSEHQQILILSCANSLKDAQNIIGKYFKYKSEAPEIFSDLNLQAEDLQQAINIYDISVTPQRTADNVVIACGKLKDTSYSNFNLGPLFKLTLMASELYLYEGPVEGLVLIIDMEGFGFLHLTKIRLGILQKFFQFIQEAMLSKIKAVHVVNTESLIDKILLIVRPFIKREIFEVIHFYRRDEVHEIFKKVPRTYVPADYGGSLPAQNILAANTYRKMVQLQSFYAELEEQVKIYNKLKE